MEEIQEHDHCGMTSGSITKRKLIGDSIFEETIFSFSGKDEKVVLESIEKLMQLSIDYDKKSEKITEKKIINSSSY